MILRTPMGKAFTVDRPFQHVYIDFSGPYPRSKVGNTHIFFVLDQLTKFVIIKTLKQATSETALNFLRHEIFLIFGVPETLLSDNGKQFVSKEFSKCMKSFGITHLKTASYSPQANASERVNRAILAAIRSYIDTDQSNWDVNLSQIGSALRSAVHSAIGMSPYEALFGQRMMEHGSDYTILRDLDGLNNSELEILPKSAKMNILHSYIKDSLEKSHQT